MSEWRFDPSGYHSTLEFHEDREVADHVNQPGHQARMFVAKELIERTGATSWIDYGCGNGGLLLIAEIDTKEGFDFQPANVTDAQAKGLPVKYCNFVELDPLPYAEVVSLCEVLEHMDDPHGFLRRVGCRWLVASVPLNETPESHWFGHVWGWDPEGFVTMIIDAGFVVRRWTWTPGTQLVLAERA